LPTTGQFSAAVDNASVAGVTHSRLAFRSSLLQSAARRSDVRRAALPFFRPCRVGFPLARLAHGVRLLAPLARIALWNPLPSSLAPRRRAWLLARSSRPGARDPGHRELPWSSLFAKRLRCRGYPFSSGVSLIPPPIGSAPLRRSPSTLQSGLEDGADEAFLGDVGYQDAVLEEAAGGEPEAMRGGW
jgi:hypothetical protein